MRKFDSCREHANSLFHTSRPVTRRRLRHLAKALTGTHATGRVRLAAGYARLLATRSQPARALGLTFHYPDRRSLMYVFEEIFIGDDYLFHTTNPRPLIIDCGSNIGVSVAYFKHLYPQSIIVAFEPEPTAFQALRRNIEENGFADVSANQMALVDREGTITLYGAPGSLLSSVTDESAGEPVQVPAGRLSAHMGDGPVDLLKIDVQGAELSVLTDLANAGKLGLVQRIIVEYHHQRVGMAGFLSLLEREGFGYKVGARARRIDRERQDVLVVAHRLTNQP